MNRLARTRSQHFVSSPRRVASPLKHKLSHTHGAGRHPPKRRRVELGTTYAADVIEVLDSDEEDGGAAVAGPSRLGGRAKGKERERERDPLSSEAGLQRVNRGLLAGSNGNARREKGRPKAVAVQSVGHRDVFDESPKKRKREESGSMRVGSRAYEVRRVAKGIGVTAGEVDDEEDEDEDGGDEKQQYLDTRSEAGSGSWVELEDDDMDEEEPEFIAENDQHLLADAPAYALHRLRKAELIRLWKVAGMWKEEDDDGATTSASTSAGDDDDGGLGKKELVDGLVAARKPPSIRLISPLPSPRNSPRRKAALEAAFEMKRLRSSTTSSLALRTPSSSSSSPTSASHGRKARIDLDATPRAAPRTRSKIRPARTQDGVTPARDARDAVLRRKAGTGKFRRRDRVARFGDDVKSPAHGLLARASTGSSAYTTTDASTPEEVKPTARHSRPTRKRSQSQAVRPPQGNSGDDEGDDAVEEAEETEVDDGEEAEEDIDLAEDVDEVQDEEDVGQEEPTPLVARLRSRTKSFAEVPPPPSEQDADDEGEDDEEAEEDEDGSPGPSSRTRSRDQLIDSGDSSRSERSAGGRRITRRQAKQRAMRISRKGGSPTPGPEDDGMEGEDGEEVESPDEMDQDEGDEESPRSGPLTRSQRRLSESQSKSPRSRHTRQSSRNAVLRNGTSSPASSSKEEDEGDGGDDDAEGQVEDDVIPDEDGITEGETPEAPAIVRTTRSGKAFGTWQSRKRRLRQEAIDDPDMEVEDEDEAEDDDEEEDLDEDEEELDTDEELELDLQDATVASLTRLLRDELVELCEARGLVVGGTKPQLARALLEWRDEQNPTPASPTSSLSSSSQVTARPASSKRSESRSASRSSRSHHTAKHKNKLIHAIASNVHVDGATTPVLLRDHIHATDPATPAVSEEGSKHEKEAELNLDLAELGLEDSIILPEHLVKLERIGSGGFKDVYVGKYKGRKIAISEFRDHLSEMDIRELKLLAEFSHPNIVRFRGICIPENSHQVPCMLVSELCENGDLFDYIRNVETPSLKRLLGLMLDIARGLEYLHTRRPAIIHRDCKSSNILINRAGQAKVGDFGLARVKHSTRSMIRSLVGTVNWQAPELWHPTPRYDYKVDVFSAGMVYWEMMSGWIGEKKYPWEGHNEHYIYDAVGQKLRRPSVAGLRKHWGAEPVNLMERMWHQDPAERPTMSDVVADLEALIATA